VQEKTPRGSRGVLALVPLGPAACFPTFDDLLTLTMWTPDGDERHETLLASGRCQDRAQCDINRSPSPHLEHYLRRILLMEQQVWSACQTINLATSCRSEK